MKKLSKLVALLLAGAMAMLLLTACGTSIPGENKEAEDAYIAKANKNRSVALQNDRDLKEQARIWLDEVVDVKTGKFDFFHSATAKTDEKGVLTAKAVAKCTSTGALLDQLLSGLNFGDNNVNVNAAGKWTKVGVVVRTIRDTTTNKDETYVSVVVQIDPNA